MGKGGGEKGGGYGQGGGAKGKRILKPEEGERKEENESKEKEGRKCQRRFIQRCSRTLTQPVFN